MESSSCSHDCYRDSLFLRQETETGPDCSRNPVAVPTAGWDTCRSGKSYQPACSGTSACPCRVDRERRCHTANHHYCQRIREIVPGDVRPSTARSSHIRGVAAAILCCCSGVATNVAPQIQILKARLSEMHQERHSPTGVLLEEEILFPTTKVTTYLETLNSDLTNCINKNTVFQWD